MPFALAKWLHGVAGVSPPSSPSPFPSPSPIVLKLFNTQILPKENPDGLLRKVPEESNENRARARKRARARGGETPATPRSRFVAQATFDDGNTISLNTCHLR